MARVTVQDAVEKIGNRFDLIFNGCASCKTNYNLTKSAPLVPEE